MARPWAGGGTSPLGALGDPEPSPCVAISRIRCGEEHPPNLPPSGALGSPPPNRIENPTSLRCPCTWATRVILVSPLRRLGLRRCRFGEKGGSCRSLVVQPQKRLTGKIGPSIARTCPPDCLTSFRVSSVWLHCARSEHNDLQLEHHYKGLLGGLQDASQLDKVCQGQLVRVYELRPRRGREGSRA